MTGANERPRSSRRIFIELMVVEFWFPENANSEKKCGRLLAGPASSGCGPGSLSNLIGSRAAGTVQVVT